MDRKQFVLTARSICFGLFVLCLIAETSFAQTQLAFQQPVISKKVYNPVTKQTENQSKNRVVHASVSPETSVKNHAFNTQAVQEVCYEQTSSCGCEDCSTGCADDCFECGDVIDCGTGCCDTVGCTGCNRGAKFFAGYEATFLQPRFSDNVAFTTTESDGATFSTITDTEFNYDYDYAPRVHFGWEHQDGVGLRATWWQLDANADTETTNPPANGFGSITHPTFGTVDISTTIPTDIFTASSSIEAYTVDLEGTKQTSFCGWDLGVGGGLRYANLEQTYLAQMSDNANTLRGEIDYQSSIEGFGPTISLNASRPITRRMVLFSKARGSLLFGDGESSLTAGEDLDLVSPFTTNRTTSRDDILSIAEIQIGVKWRGNDRSHSIFNPFWSLALESQYWDGVGNATSEDGSIGFFGGNVAVGLDW